MDTPKSAPKIRDAPAVSHHRGDLHTVTNALGHVTTVEAYDPHGRPTRVLDPNGVATEHTYDQRGRVTETRVAAGTPDEAVTRKKQDTHNFFS